MFISTIIQVLKLCLPVVLLIYLGNLLEFVSWGTVLLALFLCRNFLNIFTEIKFSEKIHFMSGDSIC